MYGDTDVMRKQAGLLRGQGEDIRALADQLVARAEAVPWSGRAADSMRDRIRERATRLRESAERHDAAAAAMETHLGVVEAMKDSIAQVERRVRRLTDDGALSAFDGPRPGHKDWLAVSLPGPTERA